MHILMIAPEPFFEPRGTPFSEFHRIRALTDLGHTVDLVTYPFGQDVSLDGLRVIRCARPPFVRRIGIGPSLAKVPLDFLLMCTVIRCAFRGRYDAVHSHEEAGVIGVLLAWVLGVPHLYDMHSSLPQQLTNFAYSRGRVLTTVFAWMERFVVRHSRVIVVICPELQQTVRGIDAQAQSVLIENAPGSTDVDSDETPDRLRGQLGLANGQPVVLYTGTFEAYQGLDLLTESFRLVHAQCPSARLVLAGGQPEQIVAAREMAGRTGIADAVIFAGQRKAAEIPVFLRMADVLVSPRSTGTNTPLKIYQYLRSGRPIVATRLVTHTQVLNDEVAVLTPATPEGFAEGILRVLADKESASEIAARAQHLAETKYSYDAYLARTREACELLFGASAAAEAGGVA